MSVSLFRQITTSLERLLALIRTLLDCTGARDASPRAASFRRRDRLWMAHRWHPVSDSLPPAKQGGYPDSPHRGPEF